MDEGARRPCAGGAGGPDSPQVELLEVDLGGRARGFFTTRGAQAPVGPGAPYAGLNPAAHVGDDPRRVAAARRLLEAALSARCSTSVRLAWMNQVHSSVVALAGGGGGAGDEPTADALVVRPGTNRPEAPAARRSHDPNGAGVLVADCVPLLLASEDGRVVAAVHAGRRGMLGGIVTAALEAMIACGARPERLRAALGPSICGACYEVSDQMQRQACAIEPACASRTRWGTAGLDVAAGVAAQLERRGIRRVDRPKWCTLEDERFYSYRRDGRTGRLAGVVIAAGDTPSAMGGSTARGR